MHSDAKIENFGHLHLECRYGYHFVADGWLSRKNFLGCQGDPPKNCLYCLGGLQNSFFQFYRGRDVKTPTKYTYLDSTQWDLQNSTNINYQYSFDKDCLKDVKFF